MSVIVRLPSQLRVLVGGAGEVTVEAATVREAIVAVDAQFPGIAFRVLDDKVFVADEDVRFLNGLDTELAAGTTVSLVPAVAGGC